MSLTVMSVVSPPQARRFGRGHHQASKSFAAAFAPSAVRVITPLRQSKSFAAVGVLARLLPHVQEAVLTVGGLRRRVIILLVEP
ncbi:hypothetical protein H2135_00965 [Aeromonas hydrophila]|uniref:hypothetical protein n=1 Tax=Aeromonas hydrophila TaxID=644 RepID=UPI001655E0E6|nr:hypothetical protein [Aeromonas hydrophila]MBC8669475.1 hypothetical protein [Aeromonas hydrophila]